MFFFSFVPYVDPSYMGRKRQFIMFLKGLHTVSHKRVCRCRSRCGIRCVAFFLHVLGSLISIVYFIWHEPFLFNLPDLGDICWVKNILPAAFTSGAPPHSPPQTENCAAFIHLKGPECCKASCLWEWTFLKRKKISQCFNEIRDAVDVDQAEIE